MRKQNMSSPSPVTDGRTVWVMTGTGLLRAFDFDGNELWMRDIQKDYGRSAFNGATVVAAAARGLALRAGAARHEDRRSVVSSCASTRRPARRSGASSVRPTRFASRPTRTRRRRCCATADTEIVMTGGDVVTGHDPATGKELWRADGLNPTNNGSLPHRRVAGRARRDDFRAVARAAAAGAQARRPRRRHGSHLALVVRHGPDVPTPVTDGKYLYSSTTAASCSASTRRPASRSTDRSGCGRRPTADRRCSPTARSTSPTKTA